MMRSREKKRILPSDAEKQRAERGRARVRLRTLQSSQLQMPRGMMRRGKKKFRGEIVRVR